MSAHSLKLGLIGAGRIGSLHAEHLTSRIPAADLIMVADAFEGAMPFPSLHRITGMY